MFLLFLFFKALQGVCLTGFIKKKKKRFGLGCDIRHMKFGFGPTQQQHPHKNKNPFPLCVQAKKGAQWVRPTLEIFNANWRTKLTNSASFKRASFNPTPPYLFVFVYRHLFNSYNESTFFADIAKNHQVRKKYTVQLGENELVLKVPIFLFGWKIISFFTWKMIYLLGPSALVVFHWLCFFTFFLYFFKRNWIYCKKTQMFTNWLAQYLLSKIWPRPMQMSARESNTSLLNCKLLFYFSGSRSMYCMCLIVELISVDIILGLLYFFWGAVLK